MRRLLIATALLPLLLSSTAAAAAGGSIKVGLSSGPNGTTFKVSFVSPAAVPAHSYRVVLRATGALF